MADELLFIDRDVNLTAAISVYLARQQFRVTCANTWESASGHLNGHSVCIIIADPDLPDGDSRERLTGFKSERPHIPLIITGGPENLESLMEHFQATALCYLPKPLKSIELDIALQHARDSLTLNRKIHQYKKRIDDLHQGQTLYRQLFDEVPCYISVQDKEFRLTATNRLFKRDFGHQIGDHCYKTYKHRNSPCPDCPVAKTFNDGWHHQTEEVVTSRAGKQYNVLTWTAPIRDGNGEITQVMEVATNITQIRRLQDQLTSLGLMLGSMSHGVKGMLTALDGGVYQLETGIRKKDPVRVELAFDRIQQMVGRVRKMVLEILYYAKSRGMQYETTPVDAFIRMVAQTIEPAVNAHGIIFDVKIAGDAGAFEIDPNWFQQALVNFLENAVDACVTDTEKPEHRIDLSVLPDGEEEVIITIGDDGIGMDAETRQKMFTLFFSSKGSKGTGLGLFIAHHIIRQHDGSIAISSEYGKGTALEIRVPRHRMVKSLTTESLM